MKITIFLALALVAFYVAQAESLHAEDAQGDALKQQQDNGNAFQDMNQQRRLKRANCTTRSCTATCLRSRMLGVCENGNCKCY